VRGILTRFFVSRTYDVAADGRIIYAIDPGVKDVADLTSLRVALHFDQEIRRRLAPPKP